MAPRVAEGGTRGRGQDGVRGAAPVVRAAISAVFDQTSRANRILVIVLGLAVGLLAIGGIAELRAYMPLGIDLEIPLRAASHWSGGAPVYPAWAMQVQSGPDLPYLYPPFLLPFLAPVAGLPREAVTDAWLVLCLATAVWTCRRLGIPWAAVPFVLAWPPFAEGLITGNVQTLCFAAFVALLYEPGGGGERAPIRRDLARPGSALADARNGILAAAMGALKVTQVPALMYLARRRFRAAAIGVVVLGLVCLATLPLTGVAIYGDWLAQLRRAADPAWTIGGVSLGRWIGMPDLAMTAAGIALALAVRGRDSVAWLGIAMIVASPSVHGFAFLFMLPALLTLRRDLSICVAALFLGVYNAAAWWIAFGIVIAALVASNRWDWLRARRADDAGAGSDSSPELRDSYRSDQASLPQSAV